MIRNLKERESEKEERREGSKRMKRKKKRGERERVLLLGACTSWHAYGGQRSNFRRWVSFSTMSGLGIEPESSGLAARTIAQGTILLATDKCSSVLIVWF